MLPDFNVKIKKCNVQGYGKNLLLGSVVQKPVKMLIQDSKFTKDFTSLLKMTAKAFN